MNRRNLLKQSGSISTRRRNDANNHVICPLVECHNGKFLVDESSTFSSKLNLKNEEVIDLCCDDDEREEHKNNYGAVKTEVKEEESDRIADVKKKKKEEKDTIIKLEVHPPGKKKASTVKRESKHEKYSSSNNTLKSPPRPAKTIANLKPLFEVGDAVYAAWWDPKLNMNKRTGLNASWYPGSVLSYKTIGRNMYGPLREYSIKYDDGDVLQQLEDCWIFSKMDYELTMKFDQWKPIGVRKKFDKQSDDMWAKRVGWYEVTVDGENQSFSFLYDAMKAHDACVIRKHGVQTKRSYLNLPEDYPELFSNVKEEASGGGGVDRTTVASTTNKVVTPTSKKRIKNEQGGGNHLKGSKKYDDESDSEESRFSQGCESSKEEEDEDFEEWRNVKRRRLDLSLAANTQNNLFWSVDKSQIEFTRQAFMSKSLFHLNSFVSAAKRKNQAFALFIREGVATPGFDPLPTTVDVDLIAGWSYSQLRDMLVQSNGDSWGASQTAMWLLNARVGSFVIMRHEYPNDKFCPKRLKDENGKYIGPVYVIGVITKKVVPWSGEERDISDNKMAEFSNHHWGIHNLCRVSWKRMGYKKSLKEETQSYINHVCQVS